MRGRLDIIVDILEVAENEVNKTSIVYGANLNFKLTEKYLDLLLKHGFMENRQDKYIATDKGKTILKKAKDVIQLLG
ncbi:MAG TPA: winged helix-turn-helix domain-containing protein [Candidatus Methanoperedens sp.]